MISIHFVATLYNACLHGDAAAVSRLLPAGGTELDLNGPCFQHPDTNDRGTPLIVAAQYGHTGIVRMILDRAPNTAVDYVGAFGATALMAAAQNHHAEILRLLAGRGANVSFDVQRQNTPLRLAVVPIPHGFPPRDPDLDGARQLATVKALLRLGAGTMPPPRTHPPTTEQAAPHSPHLTISGPGTLIIQIIYTTFPPISSVSPCASVLG